MRDSGLFADGLLDPHFAGFERVSAIYPWDDATRLSSHNDPNPRNFLFDGTRLWLIDWETAYLNDPDAPSPEAFRNDVLSGRLPLGSRQMLVAMAKMNLAAFIAGLADPNFTEVLAATRG